MKKLTYLLPLVFVALNLLPTALYKQSVSYNDPVTGSLSPAYWAATTYEDSGSGTIGDYVAVGDKLAKYCTGYNSRNPKQVDYKAAFYGFPLGAYFVHHTDCHYAGIHNSTNVSAYALPWLTIDGLLFVGSLALTLGVNNRLPGLRKQPAKQKVPIRG